MAEENESLPVSIGRGCLVEESLKDMDETRTVTYEHVQVQYAHPALVKANYEFQERLYADLVARAKVRSKR